MIRVLVKTLFLIMLSHGLSLVLREVRGEIFEFVNFLIFSFLKNICFKYLFSNKFSHVRLFGTPWTAAHQASLSITNSRSLLRLMSIELVMPSNHLILCHNLLLLPSVFPSIRVFSSESALHQVAKILEFQLQHQSFQ